MSPLDVPVALLAIGLALGFVLGVYTVHRFPRGFRRS